MNGVVHCELLSELQRHWLLEKLFLPIHLLETCGSQVLSLSSDAVADSERPQMLFRDCPTTRQHPEQAICLVSCSCGR